MAVRSRKALVLEDREHALNSFCKIRRRRDEAHHQVAIRFEIVEMPWVYIYLSIFKQIDCEIFIRARCGHAKHRIPTAFELQSAAGFVRRELRIEPFEIVLHAILNLPLDSVPLLQKRRQSGLDWRVHREIGVGDDL